MSKIRIFNDPIYGLVSYPFEILYLLIDHPYVQRLRRIKQTGFADFVYPGATHSRFHHALGALQLTVKLIEILRKKAISISDKEYEAVCIASLLHDIGHGPYSHALEHELIDLHHENLTGRILDRLNDQFSGRLTMAIEIFSGQYEKKFLSQILSGQLDTDRMDYLNRDSFYTGVSEGIIGYERILSMMNVVDNEIVVEEKGRYSIEKYLMSRFLMYLQVYHHKTSLAIEQMSKIFIRKYRSILETGARAASSDLEKLLVSRQKNLDERLDWFLGLDDSDFLQLLKKCRKDEDPQLAYLSSALLERNLFKTRWYDSEKKLNEELERLKTIYSNEEGLPELLITSNVSVRLYSKNKEIQILKKDGSVCPFSEISLFDLGKEITRFALSVPVGLIS